MTVAPESLNSSAITLFLDVDGTLLEIRDNPADVIADNELIVLLRACSEKLGGALSLISGRSIAEVDRIFAPAIFPVAGAHGAEHRFGIGTVSFADARAMPDDVLSTLERFVVDNDGLLLERKRGGVSLHYRGAPGLARECQRLVAELMPVLGDAFRVIAGKMVLEIAPAGQNKGVAIQRFLERKPFAGRLPVFVGDDVTDEDGFREVIKRGGTAIRVGDIESSVAQYRLPNVAAVRPWLNDAILGPVTKNNDKEHTR